MPVFSSNQNQVDVNHIVTSVDKYEILIHIGTIILSKE